MNSVLRITTNIWYDGEPSLNGDVAVWRAYYGNDSNYVYRYKFSTGELIRLSDETFRDVSGSYIVTSGGNTYWLTTSENYRLYAAPVDSSSPVRTVTPPDLEAYNVDIDDGIIAYQTYGDYYEIHYADINAVAFTTVQITHGTDYSENPAISNGVIAWEEYVDAQGNYEIFYYDINAAAPTLVQVSDNPDYDDKDVDIDDGIITWRASDGSDPEIYYADISVGASTFVVVPVTDNAIYDYYPRVDNGLITWCADGDDTDYEVYYYDLNAASPVVTQVTDNLVDDHYPVSAGGVIAWSTELAPYIAAP
ncbi:MAG: hypothetical protein RRA15_07870 [bacterium]|nr:hypothetical protein [bacterium]MDT8366395.1 hypothetical protein [bacterium]